MVVHTYKPGHGRLRQETLEFEASLGLKNLKKEPGTSG
jgi:hypothetical protein